MKSLLKLEELGQFFLSILLFMQLPYPWWLFPALILVPDVSMAGYLVNNRLGAVLYNIFHHKLVAVVLFSVGFLTHVTDVSLIGIILFGHAALDRVFGFGL